MSSIHDPGLFKNIFFAGAPGAGKSSICRRVGEGHGLRISNIDNVTRFLQIKSGIPIRTSDFTPAELALYRKIRDWDGPGWAHTMRQLDQWLNHRLGVILDGTGRYYDTIADDKRRFEQLGYESGMIFVHVSLETAQARNRARGSTGQEGRVVPPEIVEETWHQVVANLANYHTLFGAKRFWLIDNDQPPAPIVLDRIWKQIHTWTRTPPDNPTAAHWYLTRHPKPTISTI